MIEKKAKTKYCINCGSLLKNKKVLISYDSDTGKPVFGNEYICPKWRWWAFSSHSNYNDYTSYLDIY